MRPENEDAVLADEALGLWLVADGMGGHEGGQLASRIAREVIQQRCAEGTELPLALLQAHEEILAAQAQQPQFGSMGTTVVALRERGQQYQIAWVGDSRAYRYCSQHRRFERLTRDHNLEAVLVAEGRLSADEAARHPQRHMLTSCLGTTRGHKPSVELRNSRWCRGDLIVLCSDGLSLELSDDEIAAVLLEASGGGPAQVVEALVQQALNHGGRDNISVIAIRAPDNARRAWRWLPGCKRN